MLISVDQLLANFEKFFKTNPVKGIIHIGAHKCEEIDDYKKFGISSNRIIWFEAQSSLVDKCRQLYPATQIYQAVLFDVDNKEHDFIITNNGISSSLLTLKEHLIEHPWVQELRRDNVKTITFKTFVNEHKIDIKNYNFVNLNIQGCELRALKGMDDYIDQLDYIYIEVNTKELYTNCDLLPNVDAFLVQKGFNQVAIKMTQHGWGDAFYVRNNFLS